MPVAPFFIAGIGAAALAFPFSAAAETVRDPASGLSITPPDGYVAVRMAPNATYPVRFEFKKPTDRDTGCQVGFAPQPEDVNSIQDQTDAEKGRPAWLGRIRAALALAYDLGATEPFVNAGASGIAMVADLRPGPGIPARSQEVRTLFIVFDTPTGRISTICVGEKAHFAARRHEFEALARSVMPPR